MDDALESIEDPLQDSLVITIVQKLGEPFRIESNAINENDVIAVLVKATVSAALDSIISDDEDEDLD